MEDRPFGGEVSGWVTLRLKPELADQHAHQHLVSPGGGAALTALVARALLRQAGTDPHSHVLSTDPCCLISRSKSQGSGGSMQEPGVWQLSRPGSCHPRLTHCLSSTRVCFVGKKAVRVASVACGNSALVSFLRGGHPSQKKKRRAVVDAMCVMCCFSCLSYSCTFLPCLVLFLKVP